MLIERRLRRNEDCQQKCNVRPLKNGAKEKKKTEFIIIKSGITLFRYIFLYTSYLRVVRYYETKEDSLILALRAISQRVQLSKQATIGGSS